MGGGWLIIVQTVEMTSQTMDKKKPRDWERCIIMIIIIHNIQHEIILKSLFAV